MSSERIRVAILGAAGRDFHNFNTFFRFNKSYEVAAFTAAQIPGIAGRAYPAELAGPFYPKGIPIRAENELESLIREERIDQCVFSYSDVAHMDVMHLASRVIAVTAVRTGCGKSQTTRYLSAVLKESGRRVVAVRHPMPYGDLVAQQCQRFASWPD